MQIRASSTAAIAAALLAANTFAAPIPHGSLVAETGRIAYYALGDSKVNVKKTERYLDDAEKALGHKFEGHARYYAYEDVAHLAAITGYWARGLTIMSAGVIHAAPGAEAHEMVHLVSSQVGNPGHFFNEGLAVALTAKGKWHGKKIRKIVERAVERLPFEAFVSGFTAISPDLAYPVAGAFVESLIKQHGLDKLVELFRAVGAGDDTDEAFQTLFGKSLTEAGSDWVASL